MIDYKDFYKEVYFDIDRNDPKLYSATQGDTKTRGFLVSVIQNGVIVPADIGTMALYVKRPDQVKLMVDSVIEDDRFRIDIPNEVFARPGELDCHFTLYGGNGEIISSRHFKMTVAESLSSAIVADDEYNALDSIMDILTSHRDNKNNPHEVTKGQVGLGMVENYPPATLLEAIEGEADDRYMTPYTTLESLKMGGVLGGGGMRTNVYLKPGTYTFTVPDGVDELTITAGGGGAGSGGGGGGGGSGGGGNDTGGNGEGGKQGSPAIGGDAAGGVFGRFGIASGNIPGFAFGFSGGPVNNGIGGGNSKNSVEYQTGARGASGTADGPGAGGAGGAGAGVVGAGVVGAGGLGGAGGAAAGPGSGGKTSGALPGNNGENGNGGGATIISDLVTVSGGTRLAYAEIIFKKRFNVMPHQELTITVGAGGAGGKGGNGGKGGIVYYNTASYGSGGAGGGLNSGGSGGFCGAAGGIAFGGSGARGGNNGNGGGGGGGSGGIAGGPGFVIIEWKG